MFFKKYVQNFLTCKNPVHGSKLGIIRPTESHTLEYGCSGVDGKYTNQMVKKIFFNLI